jgi:hypothetical protein
MSAELYVLLTRANLPGRNAWQNAITKAGFDLRLDLGLQPGAHAGYTYAIYRGKESGFELEHFPIKWTPLDRQKMRPNKDLERRSDAIGSENALDTILATEIFTQLPEMAEHAAQGRDLCVCFRIGPDVYEAEAACIAAAILKDISDGVLFDDDGLVAGDALAWARGLSRPPVRTAAPASKKAPWPRLFLSLIRERHADYTLNPLAKGMTTECLRRDSRGWYFSQNTVCASRSDYYHGFALLLAPPLIPYLCSPYVAGGRFDHNYTIDRAFADELGLGPGSPNRPRVHSTHSRRKGAEDIVRRCTANAETYLAPLYETMLVRAAPSLLRLTEDAIQIRLTYSAEDLAVRFVSMRKCCLDLRLEDFASQSHPFFALPEPDRHFALAGFVPEIFDALDPHFPDILATLAALASSGGANSTAAPRRGNGESGT